MGNACARKEAGNVQSELTKSGRRLGRKSGDITNAMAISGHDEAQIETKND